MRRTELTHSLFLFATMAALSTAACGDDDDDNGGSCGTACTDAGNDSGNVTCKATISPSTNDVQTLLDALTDLSADQTLCLSPGTYKFDKQLTFNGTPGVTIRGTGNTRDDVLLDFQGQTTGSEAFSVEADRFTVENLTVKDPPGDGIKITKSDRPTFRNVRAYYSTGSVASNGSYALYPAESTNVLLEDCEVSGSSDAAIYLGQSTTGIVRRNKAHDCVIGIEAENSEDVEIYDNEAWNNTTGILVVNLPNLPRKQNQRINVHDNITHDNNHANFGAAFAGDIPPGSGITVMASDDVEIAHNTIKDNDSPGIIIVSWPTFAAIGGNLTTDDPAYDMYTERVYVHDNTFSGNGLHPQGVYADPLGFTSIEDIVWDGVPPPGSAPGTKLFCAKNNGTATFRNITVDGVGGAAKQHDSLAAQNCEFPALSPITIPSQ